VDSRAVRAALRQLSNAAAAELRAPKRPAAFECARLMCSLRETAIWFALVTGTPEEIISRSMASNTLPHPVLPRRMRADSTPSVISASTLVMALAVLGTDVVSMPDPLGDGVDLLQYLLREARNLSCGPRKFLGCVQRLARKSVRNFGVATCPQKVGRPVRNLLGVRDRVAGCGHPQKGGRNFGFGGHLPASKRPACCPAAAGANVPSKIVFARVRATAAAICEAAEWFRW